MSEQRTEVELHELSADDHGDLVLPRTRLGVSDGSKPSHRRDVRPDEVLDTIQALGRIRDLDTLLEQVLTRARELMGADAGTLYLRSSDDLYFSFVQNDTLFRENAPESRYVYASRSLSIDRSSLAGYVASTGEVLVIDDVYELPDSVDYSFNPAFDRASNYRTRSMLLAPLKTRDGDLVGVLQLINAQDAGGRTTAFSNNDRLIAAQFAQAAADAIERARMSREMVLRMVELAAMRDPFETAQHSKRVGAFSVELYDAWALQAGVDEAEIAANREILRTAAMLHDVGKVAITDIILRKRGPLTDEEMRRVRLHTIFGARLFRRLDSPWDRMAHEVALNHHERWDGTGYPGRVLNIFERKVQIGPPKRGEEIPVVARIVAVADVFDALVSRRAYKPAWSVNEAYDYIRQESGKQFDPVMVDLFLGMPEVVSAIQRKYSY